MDENCKSGDIADWNSIITGEEEGDGWLRVETPWSEYAPVQFLPLQVNGCNVLLPVQWEEAREPSPDSVARHEEMHNMPHREAPHREAVSHEAAPQEKIRALVPEEFEHRPPEPPAPEKSTQAVQPTPFVATAASAAAAAAAKAYAAAAAAPTITPPTSTSMFSAPLPGLTPLSAAAGTTTHGGDAAAGNEMFAEFDCDFSTSGLGGRTPSASPEIMFAYVQTLGRRVEEAMHGMGPRLQALEDRIESQWNQGQQLDQRLNKVDHFTKMLAEKAFKVLSNHKARREEELFGRCMQNVSCHSDTDKVHGIEKDIAKLAAMMEGKFEALEEIWERRLSSDIGNRLEELEHNFQVAFAGIDSELASLRHGQQQHSNVLQGALMDVHSDTIDAFLGGPAPTTRDRGLLALPAPQQDMKSLMENHDRHLKALQLETQKKLSSIDEYVAQVGSLRETVSRVFPEVSELKYKVEGANRMADTVKDLRRRIEELDEAHNEDVQKIVMAQDAANEMLSMSRSVIAKQAQMVQSRDLAAPEPRQESTAVPSNITAVLQEVEARVERNEARLERRLGDITNQLTPLQEFIEQQRLQTWQVSRQVPDLAQKVDHLWTQCQNYFAKIKEHDIHMGFVRNSVESHKHHGMDLWPSANSEVDELEERLQQSNGKDFAAGELAPPDTITRPETGRPRPPRERSSIFDDSS